MLAHAQEMADGGPVGRRDQPDGRLRQVGGTQARVQAGRDRPARMEALATAAQDGGVARLQAQSTRVGGHVGPALVDDADDTQRHRDPRDVEAVRARPACHLAAHRVVEPGDHLEAVGHGVDPLPVERQAIEHRGIQAARACRIEIVRVGVDDGVGIGAQTGRRREQGTVFLRPRGGGEDQRGRPGGCPHRRHRRAEIIHHRIHHAFRLLPTHLPTIRSGDNQVGRRDER